MAIASLFTLLDDIASVLDDVAVMTKVAAKKTAGVVGDDLALNANQVTGVRAERELPIVWAVAKGSLINKVILIPLSLLLSAFMPWLIVPLLIIGGAFLCFEGVEKLLHKLLNRHDSTPNHAGDLIIDEAAKIKGAIRTDFILSAEIIIIALGIVSDYGLLTQSIVMTLIGIGMTILVYGLVAGIVKMDDLGMWLMQRQNKASQAFGQSIITIMPWFMRLLSIVGTLAMFLVGGGIIVHNTPIIHHTLEHAGLGSGIMAQVSALITGIIVGLIVCAIVLPIISWWNKRTH